MPTDILIQSIQNLWAFSMFLERQDSQYRGIIDAARGRLEKLESEISDRIGCLTDVYMDCLEAYDQCLRDPEARNCEPLWRTVQAAALDLQVAQQCRLTLLASRESYSRAEASLIKILDARLPGAVTYLQQIALAAEEITGVQVARPSRSTIVGSKPEHSSAYSKARRRFLVGYLEDSDADPTARKFIHDQIAAGTNYIRTPQGYHVSHKRAGVDLEETFWLEKSGRNQGRYHVAKAMGLDHVYS